MRPNPDPVWILFRRRTFSRLVYWCLVLGYDVRDQSLTNRFYFLYFCAFWLAWVLAIFFLLGSSLAGLFSLFPAITPPAVTVLLGAFILAVWAVILLWQVARRSPFIFSEPDAYLLCQAPVHRRSVGVAWFLMDWFVTAFLFATGATIISFALTEAALPHAAGIGDLPAYFASSLRALAVILPLQMGLQAGLWGLGALRLRRDRPPGELLWLRLTILILGLSLLTALFFPGWLAVILTPLILPLHAAFGDGLSQLGWLARTGLGWLLLPMGMVVLMAWSERMHLGRAAQETRLQSIIRLHQGVLNFEMGAILRRQNRMAVTHSPSQLPVRSGAWILVWKDVLQSQRSLRLGQVLGWVWVFFLGLGIFLANGWLVQLVVGILWAVSLGALTTDRFRNDLARWWLLRSLRVRNSDLLLAQLGPACGLGLLLGWLVVVLSGLSFTFGWLAAALLPFLVVNAALGTARDVLDHAKTRVLMTPALAEENVPRQDIQGVVTVLGSVGLPLGLMAWSSFHPGAVMWGVFSLPVAAVISALLFQSVCSIYRWIK